MFKIYNLCTDLADFTNMDFPPRYQRHQYLRFEGLQYIDVDIANFETRLGKIYKREVHRVYIFTFGGLTKVMDEGLRVRMLMEHRDAQGQSGARRHMSWRQFILALGLHIIEEMETAGFGLYWIKSGRQISNKGDLSAYWREISFEGDFLGLTMIVRDLPVIDMAELVRLQFYIDLDDTWTWVAPIPEKQQVVVVGALDTAEDAPIADEGALTVPAPVQDLAAKKLTKLVKYRSYGILCVIVV
ncbi:hypothetical protein Tco_1355497, partial [Tanacetum coccineum]